MRNKACTPKQVRQRTNHVASIAFKLADQEVIEFYGRNATNTIPGAPDLDFRYAVDGQRELTIHKPLPTASAGFHLELRNRVIGIYDKGSAGSVLETEQEIVDVTTGEVYTTTRTSSFLPKQGNWGGPRGKGFRMEEKVLQVLY